MIPASIINEFGSDYVKMSSTDEVVYLCPFCLPVKGSPDKSGHLYIHLRKLVYFCHRCESRGSLKRSDEIVDDGRSVSSVLSKLFNDENRQDPYTYFIPSKYPKESDKAYEYLISRGIDDDLQRFYDIRIGDTFSDMFGRVLIPNIVKDNNFTDMYVGRTYIKDKKRYKNPIGAPKNKVVFNLHRIDKGLPIIITEGVFSAISAGKNAVALYGKYASDIQIKMILRNKPSLIYVCLDSDAYENSIDLCEKLRYNSQSEVRVVDLPTDKDPSDLGNDLFQGYLDKARPYSETEVFTAKLR